MYTIQVWNLVPSLVYTRVTNIQGTNRKVHTTKTVDNTYSSQVWNIKEKCPMCSLPRIKPPCLLNAKSCSWKRWIPHPPCQMNKMWLVTWECSSSTVTKKIKLLSLPTDYFPSKLKVFSLFILHCCRTQQYTTATLTWGPA